MLGFLEHLGNPPGQIIKEAADGCQALIASPNLVPTVGFQALKEGENLSAGQVGQRQPADLMAGLLSQEQQEEFCTVTIAFQRTRPQPFLALEVIFKKAIE